MKVNLLQNTPAALQPADSISEGLGRVSALHSGMMCSCGKRVEVVKLCPR